MHLKISPGGCTPFEKLFAFLIGESCQFVISWKFGLIYLCLPFSLLSFLGHVKTVVCSSRLFLFAILGSSCFPTLSGFPLNVVVQVWLEQLGLMGLAFSVSQQMLLGFRCSCTFKVGCDSIGWGVPGKQPPSLVPKAMSGLWVCLFS